VIILPGILEIEWSEIEKKLDKLKTFTNIAHIDIIDGKFVDNKTFLNPEPFKKYSSDIFLELHMMVENPINLLDKWGSAGFKRFIGHIEHMDSQNEFLTEAKKWGEAGLALDGPTPVSAITASFDQIDSILIYTSTKVGFSGPPLMDERLDKIRHLKKLTNIPIEADGGINDKTIERAKAAGASRFVSTSCIWNAPSPSEKYRNLQDIIR
jgi:ribulose-phosphate 3-epimerase